MMMETLSDDWPNYFPICEELQMSLDSLSAMQGIGMQKHHSYCILSTFLYLIYTGKNVESNKRTASEDEVFLQATRAHMGSNKTGSI